MENPKIKVKPLHKFCARAQNRAFGNISNSDFYHNSVPLNTTFKIE